MQARALIALLAQHAGSYLELGAAAAAEYRQAVLRSAALAATGAGLLVLGVFASWIAGLAALWDTSWRVPYAGISAVLLLCSAFVCAGIAMKSFRPGPMRQKLQRELHQDMELVREWKRTL